MIRWKITGLIATVIIILVMPLYVLKMTYLGETTIEEERVSGASYVGHDKCIECHRKEYDKWRNSHHDMAMDVADEKTVLGDFDNAIFEHHGVTSRFYRKDGKYVVHTQGPEGKMGDYEIAYTFGYYPLQQYLIPFPGGRLQCLLIAWDSREKKWYHLYPDEPTDPKDWLYWTNAGQNWNGMCAECHSTNLRKGYDPEKDAYQTTWSEIDVSCEACHGPGSRHVEWAALPEMARPQGDNNFELEVRTDNLTPRSQVELCAPCHSRRSSLGNYNPLEKDLLDNVLPSLLREGLYYPDGQILDEVYVYGSFTQSKMYHRDVRCSDCHDVHSIKLVKEGNDLCLQCHRADSYDTKDHHFHKKAGEEGEPIRSPEGDILFQVGEGAACVTCHMPGRDYMGVDYRPDHSFRIPRPDLSIDLGTPNACNRCHLEKSNEWSLEYMNTWYGLTRKPHYGTIISEGRRGLPEAREKLIELADDALFPVIVRATALSLLGSYPGAGSPGTYPGAEVSGVFQRALADEEALIRRTAVSQLNPVDPKSRIRLIAPQLYDPVKAVRMEAARNLTAVPPEALKGDVRKAFEAALDEYIAAMAYSADFASSQFNLGNTAVNLGRNESAEGHYRAALRIDDAFYPAKVNLAMFYNRMGKKGEAEDLLREVLAVYPDLYDVAYSLGLLLAEKKKYVEAAIYLKMAAVGLPGRSRVHYNLGLLLQALKRDSESEAGLIRALEIEPDQMDYLYALADFYIKRDRFREARGIAEQMVSRHPSNPLGRRLLGFIEGKWIQNK